MPVRKTTKPKQKKPLTPITIKQYKASINNIKSLLARPDVPAAMKVRLERQKEELERAIR